MQEISVKFQSSLPPIWHYTKKFSIKDFFSNPQFSVVLVTFTGEILNGELHFLYSVQEKLIKTSYQACSYTWIPLFV